jgi:hypothetical protein
MRTAGKLVLLALLAVTGTETWATQLADFDARRAEAQERFQEGLDDYIEWCRAKRLFEQRRKACELLLELDPDHAGAHDALGHERAKDGTWNPPAKPKKFRDFDKEALREAPERWDATTAAYVAELLALLESDGLSEEQQALAAADALRFDPDHARIHELLGEVRGPDGWVLPESLAARAQRDVLRAHVRTALEEAPASQPVPPNERERKVKLELEVVAAPGLRVAGTAGEDELRLGAHAVLALERLAQLVFGSKYALPEDCTVYMLSDPAHRDPFLAGHPGITPESRAYYALLESAGIIGTNDFAAWTGDTQRRIDAVVRLVLGFWLAGAFEIDVSHGWAFEGFGLFVTRSLVRTRMTWLAQPSAVLDPQQDLALRQKLLEPEANWMDEAHRLLLDGRFPALGELVKKPAGGLTTEDVLASYALATYLLEARPDAVGPMLAKLGRGTARLQTLQEALGRDAESFERHLTRWLAERR